MSTSELQKYTSELLSIYLGQHTIRENVHPDWLITPDGARLELDFYIEELRTAIEVQGAQHYIYTPYFHKDYDGFRRQVKRDEFKRSKCKVMGVALKEVSNETEARDVVLGMVGKGDQYPIHRNAIEQAKNEQAKKTCVTRCSDRKIFGGYPGTVKKHLRRMRRALLKKEREGKLGTKGVRKLREGIEAIRQYQEATGEEVVRFDSETSLILSMALEGEGDNQP